MSKECENCIKRKTMWCPPSCECMALDELPYHLDKTLALQKIDNLQQENKQLKEEIENIKDFNNKLQASKDRLDKDDYNLAHILTELEEWLKEQEIEYPSYYWDLNNKIQELKEKINEKINYNISINFIIMWL